MLPRINLPPVVIDSLYPTDFTIRVLLILEDPPFGIFSKITFFVNVITQMDREMDETDAPKKTINSTANMTWIGITSDGSAATS